MGRGHRRPGAGGLGESGQAAPHPAPVPEAEGGFSYFRNPPDAIPTPCPWARGLAGVPAPEASGRTLRAPLRARQSVGSFCLQQRKRRERALFPKHPKFRGPCFPFPRECFSRTQTTCLHLSLKGSSCDLEKRNRALKRRFTPSLSGHRRASLT